MVDEARELELKRLVDDGFEIRPERVALPDAALSGRHSVHLHDRYYDTEDLRLARWGVTLRWREGDGWTVKIPRPSDEPEVLDRHEVHVDGDPGTPPPDALALIAAFARGEPLVEVAELHTERTVRTWRAIGGAPVGELVDDRVVGTPRERAVRFREIEFEIAPGTDHANLRRVAECLGLEGEPATPKLVRVLGADATAAPDVVVPGVPEHPSAADVIRTAVAASAHLLLTNVPAARLGVDPEGVHQARVATRRLRSDLRTFAPLLDRDWAKRLRRELGWLAAELGKVRDADVLDGHLAATLDANPEIDREAGAEIRAHLAAERDRDREKLLDHLADARARELFDHLVEAAAAPRIRRRARKPADRMLPPLVDGAWRELSRRVDGLDPSPADVELHEVRILAKRVRYAAEAVAPAIGREARRFAKGAAAIQDALGDLNDSVVAAEWLERVAVRDLGPREAFAAGRLAERLRVDAAPDRAQWHPGYEKMRRRSNWLGGS